MSDQTVRKADEARLEEAYRQSRKLVHALDLTHAIVRDLNGSIRVWTQGAQELYGWTPGEAVGAVSHELLRTEFPAPLDDIEDTLKSTGRWEGELKHHSKDGREIFVASHWALHFDDTSAAPTVIEVNNDITDRKTVELSLRESEERFRKVFDESPVGNVFVQPVTGLFLRVNPAFARMLGYSQEELEGMSIVKVTHPDDADVGFEEARRVFRGELGHLRVEKRFVAKNGAVIWASVNSALVRGDFGQPLYNLSIVEDITRRKQMQEELHRRNQELAEFSSIAAHDLQTPLRNIRLSAEFLAERYVGQLDRNADEFIRNILSGTEQMHELLQALLKYAQAGEAQTLPKPVPVESVVNGVLANLKTELEQTGAEVICERLPVVQADAVQLSQLFQNLIGNALKYCGTERPRIAITAQKRPQEWCFSIQDNGLGIPAEDCEKIFAPLKRLHGPEIPGNGIGLAICKKIVERAGGRIWVESQAGLGSTFHFTLAAAEPEAETLASRAFAGTSSAAPG